MDDLATRMRRLAHELSVGWNLEPDPDPYYKVVGDAFKEAARRILLEVDR